MVGVGLDKTNYRYWWNRNDPIVGAWYNSNSWSLVRTHWSFEIYHSPGGYDRGTMPGTAAQYNSTLSVGDLLFYDWTSDGLLDHVAIQVGRGTDPDKGWWGDYVDAHSHDHYHAFWSLRQYNPTYPQTTIHLMHIGSGN
jgi:cell wall-associated NlpC family hydrolase